MLKSDTHFRIDEFRFKVCPATKLLIKKMLFTHLDRLLLK